jgi:hypothetical protein
VKWFAVAGVLSLLLYLPVLSQVGHSLSNPPVGMRAVSTPAWALIEGVRSLMLGLGAGGGTLAAIVVVLASIIFSMGLMRMWRERPFALQLFLLPILVILIVSVVMRGTMYPRFWFPLIGFGIIIGVRGLTVWAGWVTGLFGADNGHESRIVLVGVCVLAAFSVWSLRFNYAYPKQDFVGAGKFVEGAKAADDLIVTVGVARMPYGEFYGKSWPTVTTAPDLEKLRTQYPRTWVVYTFPRYIESVPELSAMLKQECASQRVFPGTVGGGDVFVCALIGQTPPRTSAQ